MRYIVTIYGKEGRSTGSRVVELQPWQVAPYLEQQISDGHHGATAEPSGSRPAGHIRWKDGWWPPVGSDLRTVLQSVYLSIV